MTLVEFITQHGDERCAELFEVEVRTVASWRRGERSPRPDKALEIVAKAGGQVSMDGIYSKGPLPA